MSSGDHKPLVIVVGRRIMYEKIDSLNPSEKNLKYAIDFFHTLNNITKSMVSSYQSSMFSITWYQKKTKLLHFNTIFNRN